MGVKIKTKKAPGSRPGRLTVADLRKVGEGAILAAIGAAASYVVGAISQSDGLATKGTFWASVAALVVPVVTNFLRKVARDTRPPGGSP